MTWSPQQALEQRRTALRSLLDKTNGDFCRSIEWFEQKDSGVPDGVWSLLLDEDLVSGNAAGGPKWRLTTQGWIEACRLLRDELGLNGRFETLSKHLKGLNPGRELFAESSTQEIAAATGLNELWVFDAIDGRMAETLFGQRGAKLVDKMGGGEIPGHVGNKL